MSNKDVFLEAIKSIKRLAKASKMLKWMVMLIFLYIILFFSGYIYSYGLGIVIDNAVDFHKGLLSKGIVYIALGMSVSAIINLLNKILSSYIKEQSIVNYKLLIAQNYIYGDYCRIHRQKTGELIGKFSSDTERAAQVISVFLPDIMRRIVVISGVVIVMLFTNLKIAFVFLVPIPAILFFQINAHKHSEEPLSLYRESYGRRDAQINDIVGNVVAIKSYQLNNVVLKWMKDIFEVCIERFTKAMVSLPIFFSPSTVAVQLPSLLVAGVGSSLVINNYIAVDKFITVFSLSILGSEELRGLNSVFANLPGLIAYSKRLFPLWNVEKEKSGSRLIDFSSKLPVLSFENVSFKYPEGGNENNQFVLKDITFEIKEGEKVAIVGVSGSGKSTIFKLSERLYNSYEGSIKICGVDIKYCNVSQLRTLISYVGQDSYIFPGSILKNIVLSKPEASSDEIFEAVNKTGLQAMIEKFPEGLNTLLDENGSNISGGQRQRILLARALLRKPKLMLLDESTSMMDSKIEKEFISNLLKKDIFSTIVVISHRLSSITGVDRILVLYEGRIVGQGNHEELLKENKIYKKLYYDQYLEE